MDPNTNPQPVTPVQTPQAQTLPNLPPSWPGAFGLYKYSKKAVKLNLVTIVLLWLLSALVSGILQRLLKIPGQVIGYLIGSLFSAGLTLTYIASIRGQELAFDEAIKKALPLWLKIFVLNILIVLSLIVSFLLLVVPFFFVLPRLTLANYYLVDKNLGIMEAYKASWESTKSFSGKIWGVMGANILMALLIVTIIGIPFAIYFLVMYSCAFAVVYEMIHKSAGQPASLTPPIAPSVPPTSPGIPATPPPSV